MPCVDPRNDYELDYRYVRRELDELTDMLCALCGKCEERYVGYLIDVSHPRLGHWWEHHKAADRARREREAREAAEKLKQQEVLRRLSPEERRLLNLPDPTGDETFGAQG